MRKIRSGFIFSLIITAAAVTAWANALDNHRLELASAMTEKTQHEDGLSFISYILGSNEGSMIVDGKLTGDDGLGLPFSRHMIDSDGPESIPLTGWVKDDGSNLYVALDVSMAGKGVSFGDASVFIRQSDGIREFSLRNEDSVLGKIGMFETGAGKRLHRVFEFKIPLSEIGTNKGRIEIAFSASDAPRS